MVTGHTDEGRVLVKINAEKTVKIRVIKINRDKVKHANRLPG